MHSGSVIPFQALELSGRGVMVWRLSWSSGAALLVDPAPEGPTAQPRPQMRKQLETVLALRGRRVGAVAFLRALWRAWDSGDSDGDFVVVEDAGGRVAVNLNLVEACVHNLPPTDVIEVGVLRGVDGQLTTESEAVMHALVLAHRDGNSHWAAMVVGGAPRARVAPQTVWLADLPEIEKVR